MVKKYTMPKIKNNHVYLLIKTLSIPEKRNFKLYVKQRNIKDSLKFVKLFDVLDKMIVYDKEIILRRVKIISKNQLANQKAHLYKVLLSSLRYLYRYRSDIHIRENIDYAKILYTKGMYMQSLKVLAKIKILAKKSFFTSLHFEIVEFEKDIESKYITRSVETRAQSLREESYALASEIDISNKLSNFSLSLYDRYLKHGFVKNENNFEDIKLFFTQNLPKYNINSLNFFSKLYMYQAHVWYFLIVQDFEMCSEYAQKWVTIFEENTHMIDLNPDIYLKGIHNLLNALHHIGVKKHALFESTLRKMELYSEEVKDVMNKNTELLLFLYLESNKINNYYITGKFTQGVESIPYWEERMMHYKDRLDNHRVLVFYYKFASLLFGAGKYRQSIKYLNKIINFGDAKLREDIYIYSKFLMLLSLFELEDDDLLEYQINSIYRYLAKAKNLGTVHVELFKLLRMAPNFDKKKVKLEFQTLLSKFKILREHPYDKRPFLYLDIISWLESKIDNITIERVIQEKFIGIRA